ncbi:MAG TPA: AI-2E family transporter, partial [Acidimicrobiales bacterium]
KTLAGAVSMIRHDRQARLKRLGNESALAITGYMAGNVLISLIASLVTYVGLWIFGVPFRGVAAVWVGFADLIPLIGATLGAVPTVGLAFLHSVTAGVGMIIIYVVYQQFENHVLQVTIMARTVKLSPLTVLVSLLVGVQLFGLLGALLAIPAAGIGHVIAVDVYRERQRARAEAAVDAAPDHAPTADDVSSEKAGAGAAVVGGTPDGPATPGEPPPDLPPGTGGPNGRGQTAAPAPTPVDDLSTD